MFSGETVTVEFYGLSLIIVFVLGYWVGYHTGLAGKKSLDYEARKIADENSAKQDITKS